MFFNAAVDNFYRPKLARAIQCSIEKIVIRLGPSLEKFEEELSLSVQNEYRQQQMAPAGGTAQVIKRYMRVLLVLFLKLLSPCLYFGASKKTLSSLHCVYNSQHFVKLCITCRLPKCTLAADRNYLLSYVD